MEAKVEVEFPQEGKEKRAKYIAPKVRMTECRVELGCLASGNEGYGTNSSSYKDDDWE